jgi:TonB family protein
LLVTLRLAVVAVCFFAVAENSGAQGTTSSGVPEAGVVLTNLSPPVYPPLARMARIMGDVKIQVGIRLDGSVASAEVISGHPMLKQAALESVQRSTFECESWSSGVYVVGCRDALTSFTLTYTFGVRDDLDGLDCSSAIRLRDAKCFYLWRCGGWRSPAPRKPAVGHSLDHVMILADPACVETANAR